MPIGLRSWRRGCLIAVSILCAFVFLNATGCRKGAEKEQQSRTLLRDDLGREQHFSSDIRRIVSLAPSLTEIVCMLDRRDALVGITTACDYPASVKSLTRVGDMMTPSIETIVGLYPDIVLVSVEGNTRDAHDRLVQLGLKTFVSNPRSFEGILKSISDIGTLLGIPRRVRQICDSLEKIGRTVADRAAAHAAEPLPGVLLIVSVDPLIAAGTGTFLDEMIHIAGARNAVADGLGNYPVIGREEILRANPDILLISDDVAVSTSALLRQFPEWRGLSAVRKSRLYLIDSDIFLRPGPRVFRGLVQLRDILDQSDTYPRQ